MIVLPTENDVPADLIDRLEKADAELRAVKAAIETLLLEKLGLKKGDVVEEQDSGLQYRITSISAGVSDVRRGQIYISLYGRRLWKTGRKAGREANTESHISSRCEKVTP